MENENNTEQPQVEPSTNETEEVQETTSETPSSEVEKWKALSRKNESELRAAQATLDTLNSEKAAWEKEREELATTKTELSKLKHELTVAQVLKESNLGEEAKGFLTGETLEELQAQAASLKALAGTGQHQAKKSVRFEGAGVIPEIKLSPSEKVEAELAAWLAERNK